MTYDIKEILKLGKVRSGLRQSCLVDAGYLGGPSLKPTVRVEFTSTSVSGKSNTALEETWNSQIIFVMLIFIIS
ncbi:MAG: hypothetical protein PWR26_11 [Methanosarcinales archaeon]|nr:MAG: hypothetical protein XD46_0127 [Euryarchaeota archaeon 55_53]KUK30700.1 MAG: hypothetical protein XD62_0209 [Methanosarcinales archeaon 56_1174]MDI3487294.1 hypothetical protein [Methanosarcinales archaeon]